MIAKKNSIWGIARMVTIVLSLVSCDYESRKEEETTPCVTDQVSFSATVKPILSNNCIVCHSSVNGSGGLNFETYAGVNVPAADGRLVGCIKHLTGFTPMPQFAPKLSNCEIAKIESWVNNGALNN